MENTYMRSRYDCVVKYTVKAECIGPLHVGSASGDRGEVLVHPVLGRPFLQATGIAGVFRDYFAGDEELQREMFGTQNHDETIESKVQFTDGFFEQTDVYTELRPRVRIDRNSGTCQTKSVNGGTAESGQKFEMEVVSSGSVFTFSIYLYDRMNQGFQDKLEQALSALHSGMIQLGGQKSNGCGYVKLVSVDKAVYDMRDEKDRALWVDERKKGENILSDLEKLSGIENNRLQFVLSGKTKGSILVKSVFVSDYSDDAPDAENIKNSKGEHIIPASSVKGAVRSQIEKICCYKGMDEKIIDYIFGRNEDNDKEGMLGSIRFYDCPIGDAEANDRIPKQNRIHIDKFTGGVMYQGLFSEKPAGGDVTIKVDLVEKKDHKNNGAEGLILLALRDIGIGVTPLGGESSIGRGFVEGQKLTISDGKKVLAEIDFEQNKITDGEEVITQYLKDLQQEELKCQNR